MDQIKKARKFATLKHKGKFYNGNQPFMVHPEEVYTILEALLRVQNGQDNNLLAAALLHDTIEDTDASFIELTTEFNEDIAELVLEVTDDGWNVFPNLKTQRGIMLKFADRLANLSHIHEWSKKNQKKYIGKSKFWKEKKTTLREEWHHIKCDCGEQYCVVYSENDEDHDFGWQKMSLKDDSHTKIMEPYDHGHCGLFTLKCNICNPSLNAKGRGADDS